ncbi:MAG: hypothetical protein QOE63_66 [Acidimicrobiaceae bacterium]
MDRVAAMPVVGAYKGHMHALLADVGGSLLDVGCGVGNDVRALGSRAIGVDPSRTMLEIARGRGGSFVRGAVEALPCAPGSFAGVQADRVLQHVADPDAAAAALARVVRPGGLVVVADPDQTTLRIEGPDPDVADVVRRYRAERGIRNGALAARMGAVLQGCGLVDVERRSWWQEITEPAEAFGIATWSGFVVAAGWFDAQQAKRFDATLATAGAAGAFRYSLDIVVTWGRVP